MGWRLATALVAGLCALAALGGTAAAKPAPLEPVKLQRLPHPEGVGSTSFPDWTPDGRHLVFAFTSEEFPNAQLGVTSIRGRGFRCLSCGRQQIVGFDRPLNALKELNLDKPYVFGDGKRILTRIVSEREDQGGFNNPLEGPTQDFNFAVLECEPSIVDCDESTLVALELPGGGLTRGVQNREVRVAPDGRFIAWTEVQFDGTRMSMGHLIREADHYELANVRVLNPPFELDPPDPEGFALGGPLYELKNFAPDGRTVTYATFADAENYDVWELDLATGDRRRLTRDIEWNEGTTRSPDNGSFVNFSSRGRDRMAPFALLPRPPFIDFAVYTLTGRFALNKDNRHCLLSPWLVDSGGERGSYFGQPIDPVIPGGFSSHGNGPFSSDGTKVAFWEFKPEAAATPEDPDSRLVVARLPARRPEPLAQPARTPDPTWAIPRAEWRGYNNTQGTFTVDGPGGGTATIRLLGGTNTMDWSVEYDGWSEDGRSFLDGTEHVLSPFTIAVGNWEADLELTGERQGSLEADVTVRTGGAASGTVRTELDGRKLEGLPPSECDPLPEPRLRVRARLMERAGFVRVRVRSRVIADRHFRPVRKARVRVGARTVRTDERGYAELPRKFKRGTPVRARAAGFAADRTRVRGPRRRG